MPLLGQTRLISSCRGLQGCFKVYVQTLGQGDEGEEGVTCFLCQILIDLDPLMSEVAGEKDLFYQFVHLRDEVNGVNLGTVIQRVLANVAAHLILYQHQLSWDVLLETVAREGHDQRLSLAQIAPKLRDGCHGGG